MKLFILCSSHLYQGQKNIKERWLKVWGFACQVFLFGYFVLCIYMWGRFFGFVRVVVFSFPDKGFIFLVQLEQQSPGNLPLMIHFKAHFQPEVYSIHPEGELKCELTFILWVHLHQCSYEDRNFEANFQASMLWFAVGNSLRFLKTMFLLYEVIWHIYFRSTPNALQLLKGIQSMGSEQS